MIVGIIGLGKLGCAIAAGLREHETVRAIYGTNSRAVPVPDHPQVTVVSNNVSLTELADVVLLCVKPFQVESVAKEIADALTPHKLIVTCAASIPTARLSAWTGGHAFVVRAMPNMPCRIGQGMTVLSRGDSTTDQHVALAESLFATVGKTVLIEERYMDAATAISGCGPAYVYVIIESLSDAGVKLGLPRNVARLLVAQTMMGSASTVLTSEAHPAALKDDVTTPAGCTIDGLMEIEDGKLRHTLLRAAVAAAMRSAALAGDWSTPT